MSYYLVHETSKSDLLKEILKEAFHHLESLGLNIVALVGDQGSNLQKFLAREKVTKEQPFIELDVLHYFIINDPPHLLKPVSYNLIKYKFSFRGRTGQWDEIKHFFRTEQHLQTKMAQKLTERHINPDGFIK